MFERRTINQLASKHKRSVNWVRKQLEGYKLPEHNIIPCKTVVIADSTFFRRTFGICVLRAQKTKQNIFWKEIDYERIETYQRARRKIESLGFGITGVVTDGRPGIKGVFNGIPVQMCHFHQRQIITRHLTTRPKLEASVELRVIAQTLCNTTEEEFTNILAGWYSKWHNFLKEKTIIPETGKWFYTHKRVRSAYHSLITNMPYLFTYLKYPDLNIPNTTNSLEGFFSHLKELIKIHRGLNRNLKHKMVDDILSK